MEAIDARAIIPVKCYPVVVFVVVAAAAAVIGDDFFQVPSAISPRTDCCSSEARSNKTRTITVRRGVVLALFFVRHVTPTVVCRPQWYCNKNNFARTNVFPSRAHHKRLRCTCSCWFFVPFTYYDDNIIIVIALIERDQFSTRDGRL